MVVELTRKEMYLIDDAEYLDRYCCDEAEKYELEKELSKQWLFNVSDRLEDDYTEDSMP